MSGAWTDCEGEVTPAMEVCDGLDNDCDGTLDEGVLNACGTCGDDCQYVRFGHEPGDEPFDPLNGDCGVQEGDLVVPPRAGRAFIWIPNTPEGTISLVDEDARAERSRFRTGPLGSFDEPSRTSVDEEAAVYVANRAPGRQSSVSRVLPVDCPDADGSGAVDRSRGRDDVLPWGEDECVDWNVPVGELDGFANAIAYEVRPTLDGALERRVWVGLEAEERYLELVSDTGEATGGEADCGGCRPVGARVDPDQRLWSACAGDEVCFFDTASPDGAEILDLPIEGNPAVGLAVDERGLVWVGGAIEIYDPALGAFTDVPGLTATTLALGFDGNVWAGGCTDVASGLAGVTCRIDPDTLATTALDVPSLGIDTTTTELWVVPRAGSASVIDLQTLAVEVVLDDCDGPCLNEPDTWSGMAPPPMLTTGSAFCQWRGVVEGCSEEAETWWTLSWDADVPEGSSIELLAGTAWEPGALDDLALVPVVSIPPDVPPTDLEGDLVGRFLVIRVTMRATEIGPVLHSLQAQWRCVV